MRRLSFSQCNLWHGCKRQWYNQKILKLPVEQDLCYANRGNVVHGLLEDWYNKEIVTLDDLENKFNLIWKKFNLDNTKLKSKKDETWMMLLNGINLKIQHTTNELKIYFKDFVCYIDVFNSNTFEISDWKTSTRSKQNEAEYKLQLQVYSWMVYRQFGWIPKKCTVHYLKYTGSKSILEFVPTMEDVKFAENWVNTIQLEIDEALKSNIFPKHDDIKDCNFFCGYKHICFGKNKIHFDLYIDDKNKIHIRGYNSPILTKGLSKTFSYQLDGSEYIEKASGWNGVVNLFDSRNYSLDVGFKNRLIKALHQYTKFRNVDLSYNIIDNRRQAPKLNIMPDKLNGVVLRDYQETAVEKLSMEGVGLIHSGTGSGKTIMATEIIRRLDVKTLWLTHKVDLAKQSKKVLEDKLNLKIGLIQGENLDIQPITVATIQTLNSKFEFFKHYLDSIDLIVFDEAHHSASPTYNKLLKKINARYRIGLSGSILDKPTTMLIHAQLGEIEFELLSKELIDKDVLAKPKIYIKTIFNNLVRGDWKEVEDEFIVNNEERNTHINLICEKENDKFNIILVGKILHGDILKEVIPQSIFLNGGTPAKEREQIIQDARDGKIKNLIATYQLFGEGIDMPNIDNIIMAQGGGPSIIPTIQNVGRVLRKNKDRIKKVFDFMDKGKYINGHSDIRLATYKELGDMFYD